MLPSLGNLSSHFSPHVWNLVQIALLKSTQITNFLSRATSTEDEEGGAKCLIPRHCH